MPDANEKTKTGICPHCYQPLLFLEKQQANTPFWQNLSRFFRFPFQLEPLLLIVLSSILGLAFLSHYALALSAALMITLALVHYGQKILKSETSVLQKAPALSSILSSQYVKQSVSASLLFGVAILSPLLAASYLNLPLALFLSTIMLWFLPALLMVKLRQEKFDNSLHIDTILAPIISMKWTYVSLVGILATLLLSSLVIIDFSLQHLPVLAASVISAAISSYFSLVMFSLLSYVLLEYKSFSKKDDSPTKQKAVRPLHEIDNLKRLDADIDIAIKSGNYTRLTTFLEKELKRASFSELRRDQLYKLLSALNDYKRLEQYAHAFLWRMYGRGQIEAAVQFIHQCRAHNPEFVLFDLELSKLLAEAFHKIEEYNLIVWLAYEAHTRFDPEPNLAELYLRVAKTLLTKQHDKYRPQAYLSYIIKHFPDQPVSESAKILQKLTQRPQSID